MGGGEVQRERGAALVEAALVTTLLVMLLVGTVTVGVTFGRSNALQGAAREGGRFGATLPVTGTLDSWLSDVRDVSKASATGDLDDGVDGQYICVAFVHPEGATRRLIETSGGEVYADQDCFSDGRPAAEQRVQVEVRRTSEINAILFSFDVPIEGTAALRFER